MRVRNFVTGCIFVFVLGGCTGERSQSRILSVTPNTNQRQETAVATETTTYLDSSLTPIPSSLPTPIATKIAIVQTKCPTIEPVSSLPEIEGQLIMNGVNHDYSPDLSDAEYDYLFDLRTGDKQSLSTKSHNYISLSFYANEGSALVSPDRSMFAYVEYGTPDHQNPELKIVNSENEQLPAPAWGAAWDKIYGWADNQTLLFTVKESFGYGLTAAVRPFESGTTTVLSPPQDLVLTETLWYVWFGKPIILYGSGLNRAVYLARGEYPQPNQYTLWDRQTDQILWQQTAGNDGFRPIWNSEGSRFVVAGGDVFSDGDGADWSTNKLFLVSEEGIEQPLVDLREAFGTEKIMSGSIDWSPDSSNLAFWVQKPDSTNIAWMDISTGSIVEYCIEGQPFQLPIWSPDGKWLAMNSPVGKEDWHPTRVILVNIATNHAYELIAEDYVVGWMKSD